MRGSGSARMDPDETDPVPDGGRLTVREDMAGSAAHIGAIETRRDQVKILLAFKDSMC